MVVADEFFGDAEGQEDRSVTSRHDPGRRPHAPADIMHVADYLIDAEEIGIAWETLQREGWTRRLEP